MTSCNHSTKTAETPQGPQYSVAPQGHAASSQPVQSNDEDDTSRAIINLPEINSFGVVLCRKSEAFTSNRPYVAIKDITIDGFSLYERRLGPAAEPLINQPLGRTNNAPAMYMNKVMSSVVEKMDTSQDVAILYDTDTYFKKGGNLYYMGVVVSRKYYELCKRSDINRLIAVFKGKAWETMSPQI